MLNGLWKIPWLLERFGIAALVIAGILESLVCLYVVLDRMALGGVERWMLGVPASLWLAWLSVAAPLNWTVWLRSLRWTPDAVVWPVAVVLAVGAVGGWLLARTGDLGVALVLGWAFTAIALNGTAGPALQGALAVAGLVVLAALVRGARLHTLVPTAHAG